MIRDESFGMLIKKMNNLISRNLQTAVSSHGMDELTIMHGWILGYLYLNNGRKVHQKELEDEFEIGKSTVTNILKLMEKKGYVKRAVDEEDSRHKVITLTAKGEEFHLQTIDLIHDFNEKMEQGITDEEKECFFRVMIKLKKNMEKNNMEDFYD